MEPLAKLSDSSFLPFFLHVFSALLFALVEQALELGLEDCLEFWKAKMWGRECLPGGRNSLSKGVAAERQRLVKGWQVVLEWGKGALVWGFPPTAPAETGSDHSVAHSSSGLAPHSRALPGINCIHGNELGPWTQGWLK